VEKESIPVKVSSEKSFAIVFSIVFILIAIYPLVSGGDLRFWAIGFAIVILIIGFIKPSLLQLPNRLWFRFGMTIGAIVAPIVMSFVYIVAVVPTGLVMKILGKDPLQKKIDKNRDSYWISRETPLQPFKNQF